MATTATTPEQRLEQAARTYLARKERTAHPVGKTDNGGRWYPSDAERQSCCDGIRSPSRAFPWSYMTHCRTIEHVAHLHGVELAPLRREVRRLAPPQAPKREGGEGYYKAVALVDGHLLSIYDGETEYRLGETLAERARQGHEGGYYVYASASAAADADVPRGSALPYEPRVVLRVRAEGAYTRYGDKLAFSRITPLEIVGRVVVTPEAADTWPLGDDYRLVPFAQAVA